MFLRQSIKTQASRHKHQETSIKSKHVVPRHRVQENELKAPIGFFREMNRSLHKTMPKSLEEMKAWFSGWMQRYQSYHPNEIKDKTKPLEESVFHASFEGWSIFYVACELGLDTLVLELYPFLLKQYPKHILFTAMCTLPDDQVKSYLKACDNMLTDQDRSLFAILLGDHKALASDEKTSDYASDYESAIPSGEFARCLSYGELMHTKTIGKKDKRKIEVNTVCLFVGILASSTTWRKHPPFMALAVMMYLLVCQGYGFAAIRFARWLKWTRMQNLYLPFELHHQFDMYIKGRRQRVCIRDAPIRKAIQELHAFAPDYVGINPILGLDHATSLSTDESKTIVDWLEALRAQGPVSMPMSNLFESGRRKFHNILLSALDQASKEQAPASNKDIQTNSQAVIPILDWCVQHMQSYESSTLEFEDFVIPSWLTVGSTTPIVFLYLAQRSKEDATGDSSTFQYSKSNLSQIFRRGGHEWDKAWKSFLESSICPLV